MKWDEPSPARAMNNGNMGGHNNVHPGRELPDGTYSDARVLTLKNYLLYHHFLRIWIYQSGVPII